MAQGPGRDAGSTAPSGPGRLRAGEARAGEAQCAGPGAMSWAVASCHPGTGLRAPCAEWGEGLLPSCTFWVLTVKASSVGHGACTGGCLRGGWA